MHRPFSLEGLVLLPAILLFACGRITPASTPPTTTPSDSPVGRPTRVGIGPASAETCFDSAKVMQEVLGMESAIAEAPFLDYFSRQAGAGCQVTVMSTGAGFRQMGAIAEALRAALQARNRTQETSYGVDSPVGTTTGWSEGEELCLLGVLWQPWADANCPKDQSVSACDIPPEQQLCMITLSSVRMGN